MKIRKLIVIAPLGLALLAAVILAWWFLGDDAWIKDKIEDTVSEMTGRSLSIDGDFALDWSTSPVLTAENIHFSNPPWAVNRDLAKLDNLELSIDLFSLFKDQIQVHYITTDGLVIALEEHESGEKSWELSLGSEEPAPVADTAPTELPIRVGSITLADFSLLHEAPGRTVPLDFHLEQLKITQRTDQQIQFVTEGRFGGEQFELAGDLGPLNELVAGGKTSHDVRLAMGEIVLQSQGSIEQFSTLSGANIKLAFSGPEFEWLLTQLALPLFSYGDFDFRLDLQTEAGQTRLDLDGDLGSMEAYANGDLNDLNGTAKLTAEVSGEDLGGLLEVIDVPGLPRNPFSLKVDIDHASGMFQFHTLVLKSGEGIISVAGQMGDWPELLDTELDFLVSGMNLQSWSKLLPAEILPGIMLPVADFELSGQISRPGSQPASIDTSLRVGDNRIQLRGPLGRLPSMTGADLKIRADGPVDGALVQMLHIEGIPGKDFSLKATLERDAAYFYLSDASFDLAGSHLELSGKSGPGPELTGSNLVFSLLGTELNLWSQILKTDDLPASAFSLNGEVLKTDTGLSLNAISLELGDNSLHLSGLVGLNDQLEGSNFQTRMTVPSLARIGALFDVEGLPDARLSVNSDYRRIPDGWAFHLTNGSLAGASFESEGKYTEIDGQQQTEATSHVSAPNLEKLARFAGIENLPVQPIEIKGFARYETGKLELRALEGRVGESQFKVSATMMNPPTWSGSDITLSASGPDIGQLLVDRNIEGRLPFSLDGKIARMDQEIQIEQVKARLGSMQASVHGNLDNNSATDLQITLSAPSLQLVGELLDYPLPDEALRLSATLQGSPKVFQAGQLEVELGPSDLSGEISVDLQAKPIINAILKSNHLDLAWFFNLGDRADSEEEPGETLKQDYLISDTAITLPQLNFADSDIAIAVSNVRLPNLMLHDIYLHSKVEDGNLILDPFQLSGEDGAILGGSLALEQDADSGLKTVALSLEGNGVRLGIGTVEGQDYDTFRKSDISANLDGSGVTYRDLATSLNGRIEVVQGPGLTGNSGLSLIFGNLIGEILHLINPFSKTDQFTVNECSVAVVNFESGLVKVHPVVLQTDKVTTVAEGEVDLHTEKIRFTFNTKLRKGIGISASMVVNPFISVTGTLQKPFVGLDPTAVAVTGTVAVATVGISLLVKSLADRYLSSKDPCGDALKKSREQMESTGKKGKSKP